MKKIYITPKIIQIRLRFSVMLPGSMDATYRSNLNGTDIYGDEPAADGSQAW